MNPTASIRFPQGAFGDLRAELLDDTSRESFALLLGKREAAGPRHIVRVRDVLHPAPDDYRSQGIAHLGLEKAFVYGALAEVEGRHDVDTLIDVHTHPFSASGARCSGTDDRDERQFSAFLADRFEGVGFGSVVLSRSDYAARLWQPGNGAPRPLAAELRTQTPLEAWPAADDGARAPGQLDEQFLARSILALGVDTLRRIVDRQSVAIVGVGGLGSLVAENLVHMGFRDLHLIDPDCLELTNLNRVVGAYHDDAVARRPKVDVVRGHLTRINPNARVTAHQRDVHDADLEEVLAGVHWIVVATDSHASRARAQELALRYAVPLVSAGVNITVDDGTITDMSGEVIVSRWGDRLCLGCLGRLDPLRVAVERAPDAETSRQLVARGYVTGLDVKQPAVKTLNASVAALAVDVLVNQYTGRQRHAPILVVENNHLPAIYPDARSVEGRAKLCYACG